MDKNAGTYATLSFTVTICYGYGDGGDVIVSVDVTEDEYVKLLECCKNDEEIEECEGLEDLVERIQEAAKAENEFCSEDIDTEEEDENYEDDEYVDEDDMWFVISMPDEIFQKYTAQIEQEEQAE